jgi:hypothetical protein
MQLGQERSPRIAKEADPWFLHLKLGSKRQLEPLLSRSTPRLPQVQERSMLIQVLGLT